MCGAVDVCILPYYEASRLLTHLCSAVAVCLVVLLLLLLVMSPPGARV
jgi:hypothetical protein